MQTKKVAYTDNILSNPLIINVADPIKDFWKKKKN